MKRTSGLFLACVSLAMFPMSSQALVLMLDFGDTPASATGNGWINSPYHTVQPSFADTKWNTVTTSDLAAGSVADSTNATLAGVSVNMGQATNTASKVINLADNGYSTSALGGSYPAGTYTAGPYFSTSPGRDGVFASGGGAANRSIGLQVLGLPAGVYEVYVAGRNTSTSVGTTLQSFYVGTAAAAGTTFDYTSYTSASLTYTGTDTATTWTEGVHYVKITVNLAAGEALNIGSEASATSSEKRGFLNTVQIVSVPEPSAIGLALLGAIPAFRRRRSQ